RSPDDRGIALLKFRSTPPKLLQDGSFYRAVFRNAASPLTHTIGNVTRVRTIVRNAAHDSASRPCCNGTAVQVGRHFQEGEFPSSHRREEGWPSDQENIAQHPLFARTGWCSDRWDKEHHPGVVDKEASHHFLDDAATPYSA